MGWHNTSVDDPARSMDLATDQLGLEYALGMLLSWPWIAADHSQYSA